MLSTSNSQYPYEHYGDLSIDFGSNYWNALTEKHIDKSIWKPVGFKFSINTSGNFVFYIWATSVDATPNEIGEMPITKIKTDISWDEFSKSFVKLNAQAFWGRATVDKFYESESNSDI